MPLAASSGGNSLTLLLIILIPVAMYFLMIRPQQRRMREQQAMQASLGVGDEVMTTSGMYATVVEVDDENGTVGLDVGDDVVITFARAAISKIITSAPAEQDDDEGDDGDEVDEPTDVDTTANQVIERKD